MMMIDCEFTKSTKYPFEQAVDVVTDTLRRKGFGIMISVDQQENFRDNFKADPKKYLVIGVCDPKNAIRAIKSEEIGVTMPCNAVIYKKGGETMLSIMHPAMETGSINNESEKRITKAVEYKLKQILDSLE